MHKFYGIQSIENKNGLIDTKWKTEYGGIFIIASFDTFVHVDFFAISTRPIKNYQLLEKMQLKKQLVIYNGDFCSVQHVGYCSPLDIASFAYKRIFFSILTVTLFRMEGAKMHLPGFV